MGHAIVSRIRKDGIASSLGLKTNDRITHIAGTPVTFKQIGESISAKDGQFHVTIRRVTHDVFGREIEFD